ncbi:MAG: helix-turn-helix transcriptional regulator [Rhodocyclaceae bacterium]|nr:helix-turn-helix transcriptional regulator [Rhodocyclaceae bacterium]
MLNVWCDASTGAAVFCQAVQLSADGASVEYREIEGRAAGDEERELARRAEPSMICRHFCEGDRILRSECSVVAMGLRYRVEDGRYHVAAVRSSPMQEAAYVAGAPGEIDAIGRMFHHMQRTVGLQRRVAAAEVRASLGNAVMDNLTFPVIVAQADRHYLLGNKPAQQMLKSGDPLRVVAGRLTARDPSDESRLAQLIRGTAEQNQANTLRVVRPARSHWIQILPMPRTPAWSGAARTPAAMLTVTEIGRPTVPVADRLMGMYGLTRTEMRVAVALARGDSAEEVAEAQHVSMPTIRSQIARVMEKTGVRRQAELVSLILSFPQLEGGLAA